MSLLATQTPLATDLRILAALLHVIRCIERMGDQCVSIAQLVPRSGHESPKDRELLDAIERMGGLARSQVAEAKDAFASRNVVRPVTGLFREMSDTAHGTDRAPTADGSPLP